VNLGLSSFKSPTGVSSGPNLPQAQNDEGPSQIEDKLLFGRHPTFANQDSSSADPHERSSPKNRQYCTARNTDLPEENPINQFKINPVSSNMPFSELLKKSSGMNPISKMDSSAQCEPRRIPTQSVKRSFSRALAPEEINLLVFEHPTSKSAAELKIKSSHEGESTELPQFADGEMLSEKEVRNFSTEKLYHSEFTPNNKTENNSFSSFSEVRSQFKSHSFPETTNTSTFQKDARSKFIVRFSENHRRGLIGRTPSQEPNPEHNDVSSEKSLAERMESKLYEFPAINYAIIEEETSKSNSSKGAEITRGQKK
jgi:hypothetical protein